jgi:hypothetical protein
VFVTGEAGTGKTALVTTFLQQLAQRADIWITQGQCIEYNDTGEAYLPVLEALSRLGRQAGRRRLARLLRQYAPMWLAQLPALLSATERDKAQSYRGCGSGADATGTRRGGRSVDSAGRIGALD